MELLRLDAEKVAGTHPEAIGERPPEKDRKRFTGDGEREREREVRIWKRESERERCKSKTTTLRGTVLFLSVIGLGSLLPPVRLCTLHQVQIMVGSFVFSLNFFLTKFFFFFEMFDFWLFFFFFFCFIFGKGNLEFFFLKLILIYGVNSRDFIT